MRARSASSARLPMITSGRGKIETGEGEAEIRADAGGLTRGDGNGLVSCAQSLYSTYASSRRRRSHSSVSSSALASRSAVKARWRTHVLGGVELAAA